jgi:hypothetical protein
MHPDLIDDFQGQAPHAARAVVIGDAGPAFSFGALNADFRELVPGADFLALASTRFCGDDDGGLSLDVSAFVAALEFATLAPRKSWASRRPVILLRPWPAWAVMPPTR